MKRIEILLRKFLLKLLLFFNRGPRNLIPPHFTKESKILFIQLYRIGDALVSTPLLKEIKNKIGCRIYILASNSNQFIFKNNKIADEIIIYKKGLKEFFKLLILLNNIEFDVIVDLHDNVSFTVSFLIALIKSPHKFGFKRENFKLFTTIVDKPDTVENHVVVRIMEFAKLFKIPYKNSEINIVFEPSLKSFEIAKSSYDKFFMEQKFTIGINISAGGEARFWGISNYISIIRELLHYNVNLLLLCSEKDLPKAIEISENKIAIYHRSQFYDFCAMIKYVDLLITPDTSIVHVASAFKIPVFGLYVKYQTNDHIWSPFNSPFECVITEEATLQNVSFDSVKSKLIPFFENYYNEFISQKR